MKILAIIPARGGSKGIPKKNIRLLAGKPLVGYSLEMAMNCKYLDKIVVSTDSKEIAEIAEMYGSDVVYRGDELSGDEITLDPVVYHALTECERDNDFYDVIVTLQPTSPLLSVSTLNAAISYFLTNNYDTVISVVNRPHLCWGKKDNKIYPLYNKRLNRQNLPPQYFETGGFVISKRDVVKENTRMGNRISVYEIPIEESIDIDDEDDWIIVEHNLQKKKIIFRVDGYAELGMGHIYNCVTLAYSMLGHQIMLVTRFDAKEGLNKIRESNLPYRTIKKNEDIDIIINEFNPDIWVNDCLNTDSEYIKHLKKLVPRVITIEDLGNGAKYADAVINALYEDEKILPYDHVYSGHRYVCLRDEFQLVKPKEFSYKVKNIIVMFGGTDPSNINKIVYEGLMRKGGINGVNVYFVTGIGYDSRKNGLESRSDLGIYVCPNEARVTKYMSIADLAITSQGRTIFELAAMHVPAIVLSQNERETTHKFATMRHGFINLGLGKMTSFECIYNTAMWLIDTPSIRRDMYDLMRDCKLDYGLQRVKRIILGEIDDD